MKDSLLCKTSQKRQAPDRSYFLFLVDLFRVDFFTSSTSTRAGLTAKLLLTDLMLLCCVEDVEVQAVSSILLVS